MRILVEQHHGIGDVVHMLPMLLGVFLVWPRWLLVIELFLYLILDAFFSMKITNKTYDNHYLTKFILYPLFHLSYGFGSLLGILKIFSR